MGRFVAVSAVAAALLVFPSAALAGWSAPRVLSFAHYSSYANTAVAVDSRGDGAVAWESVGGWPAASQGRRCSPSPTRQGCFPLSSVHVAVRIAGGALVTRTLWSGRVDPTMHLSVVIGGASVTVAWGYSPAASELETVRAAYGPLAGRWSPSRAIGRFIGLDPFFEYPQLALAPSGAVLAAWNACVSSACRWSARPGVTVAWRSLGRGFGAAQVVHDAALGAFPQFDAGGTAYMYSHCSGRVLIAPGYSHRFSRAVMLTPGPALAMNLAVDGAGRGLASWVAGACSYDEAVGSTPGPVFVSRLRGGTFTGSRALTSSSTMAISDSAAAVAGGGTVSWAVYAVDGVPEPFSVQLGANGLVGATDRGPGALIAIASDGGGDAVLEGAPGSGSLANRLFIRPAPGGGADQPAPAASGVAAAAPFGRAAAVAWYSGSAPLRLSLWSP